MSKVGLFSATNSISGPPHRTIYHPKFINVPMSVVLPANHRNIGILFKLSCAIEHGLEE